MTFMPRRRKRERFNSRPETHYRNPRYMQHARGFVCLAAGKNGHVCSGKNHAHHVRLGTDGAGSTKPSDWWCVPVCEAAHSEIHGINGGQATFDKKYGVDSKAYAERIWKASKHYREWINQGGKDNG
jgi:hypothetical protein